MALCHRCKSCRWSPWIESTSLSRQLGENKYFKIQWILFFYIRLYLKGHYLFPSFFLYVTCSLLWLYLRARHGRDGHSYCSVKGCERVKILATTSSKQTCNCTAKAYPKYSKGPSAAVPMPAANTQPCEDCGAKQVCYLLRRIHFLNTSLKTHEHPSSLSCLPSQLVFSSEPWNIYLQTIIKSLSNKEQQRGDNNSFITVSHGEKQLQTHCSFSWMIMSLWTMVCVSLSPGKWGDLVLLSAWLFPGLSGRLLWKSYQENLIFQSGYQDATIP